MECKKNSILRYVALFFLIFISSCSKTKTSGITIAAAANMQFAIREISKEFTEQTGIVTKLIISSSGKLTAQIKEGAPYDIFLAADMKYPNKLHENDLTISLPKVYGYGQLVLWTCYDNIPLKIENLTETKVQHIAVANPITAPYGEKAIDILKKHQVYDTIKHKLVYGESIAQTNQFIMSKSASIGFTAKSVVVSPYMKGKGYWKAIDTDLYQLISQGVVLIKRKGSNIEDAQKFYDFLFSVEAKEILEDFGYLMSE